MCNCEVQLDGACHCTSRLLDLLKQLRSIFTRCNQHVWLCLLLLLLLLLLLTFLSTLISASGTPVAITGTRTPAARCTCHLLPCCGSSC
jgi:hypothetical protein